MYFLLFKYLNIHKSSSFNIYFERQRPKKRLEYVQLYIFFFVFSHRIVQLC
jgi:hypothetical protein